MFSWAVGFVNALAWQLRTTDSETVKTQRRATTNAFKRCLAFWSAVLAILTVAATASAATTYISGANQNWLYTDITGANTTIDADHANSWLITVASGQSVPIYGGNFTIKTGGSATDNITLDLYPCAYKCGSPIATSTVLSTNVTGQYTATLFSFGSAYTLSGGANGKTYFAILHSSTGTSGTAQYFYKGGGSGYIGDGVSVASASIVTVTPNPVGSRPSWGVRTCRSFAAIA